MVGCGIGNVLNEACFFLHVNDSPIFLWYIRCLTQSHDGVILPGKSCCVPSVWFTGDRCLLILSNKAVFISGRIRFGDAQAFLVVEAFNTIIFFVVAKNDVKHTRKID